MVKANHALSNSAQVVKISKYSEFEIDLFKKYKF